MVAVEILQRADQLRAQQTYWEGVRRQANAALEGDPGLINKSPYEDGWIFAMEISNPAELNSLMTEDQYLTFLKSGEAAAHH